jgi:hypothetical protein
LIGAKSKHWFISASLVAAHDPHDDAGDHEGEDEYDDVEGYAHYVHENMLVISGLKI